MSDEALDYDEDVAEGSEEPNVIRTLRKQAEQASKQAKEAQAELEALRRKTAFMEAGIDPADKRMAYFVKGYDGEVNADAIKAQAVADGFLEAPAGTPAEELDAHDRIAQAGSSASPPLGAGDQMADYERELRESDGSPEQVMAIAARYGRPTTDDLQ